MQTEEKYPSSCNAFFLHSAWNKNVLQETKNPSLFIWRKPQDNFKCLIAHEES